MTEERKFKPVALWQLDTEGVGIHHVTFSPNEQEIAVSQWDGKIQIISSRTGRISYTIPFLNEEAIVTCTRFHPKDMRYILSVGNTGDIALISYTSSKIEQTIKEKDNQIYTCDIADDGEHFSTAGKDGIVRNYDTKTMQLRHIYSSHTGEDALAHTARIYSLVYSDSDDNIMFSGGWDNRVIMWDNRTGTGIRTFSGPNICGDTLDVFGDNLLTGSLRDKNPLEIWDIGSGKVLYTGNWGKNIEDKCQIYSCKFSRMGKIVLAGGSESSALKTFSFPSLQIKERVGYYQAIVNSVLASNSGNLIIGASQDGKCFAFSQEEHEAPAQPPTE